MWKHMQIYEYNCNVFKRNCLMRSASHFPLRTIAECYKYVLYIYIYMCMTQFEIQTMINNYIDYIYIYIYIKINYFEIQRIITNYYDYIYIYICMVRSILL